MISKHDLQHKFPEGQGFQNAKGGMRFAVPPYGLIIGGHRPPYKIYLVRTVRTLQQNFQGYGSPCPTIYGGWGWGWGEG